MRTARPLLFLASLGALSCSDKSAAPPLPQAAGPGCDVVVPPKPDDPNARAVDGVVFSENGLPLNGARVSVGNQIALTGPGGGFGFRDVDVPYDVVVRDGTLINAFVGLARQHVVLHTTALRRRRAWSGHIVTEFPVVPALLFLAEGSDVTAVEPEEGGILVRWTGAYSVDVVLHAVAYDVDPKTRLPAHYIGQTTFTGQLVPDAPQNWQTPFYPIEEATMVLTPQVPAGYAQASFDAVLDLGGASQATLGPFPGAPSALLLPALPGASVHLHAVAASGDATSQFVTRSIAVTTPAVEMLFATAPSPVSPADNAVGTRASAAQVFAWTAAPGANQLFLVPESDGDPAIVITTSATTASVSGAALQTTLPRGALYHWSVRHWEETPSGIDQLMCPGFDERTTRTAISARRTWFSPP